MEKAIVIVGGSFGQGKSVAELNRYLSHGWTVKFAVPFNDGEDVLVIIQESM